MCFHVTSNSVNGLLPSNQLKSVKIMMQKIKYIYFIYIVVFALNRRLDQETVGKIANSYGENNLTIYIKCSIYQDLNYTWNFYQIKVFLLFMN